MTRHELEKIGFNSIGRDVYISKYARFYNPSNIKIGNNVRIDDFCILSAGIGGIEIGNYVHIGIFSSIQGDGKVTIQDFSGISSRVSIYSSNDDYLGFFLTNPTVPKEFRGVVSKDVIIEKHVIIGSGSIILPGVRIKLGAAVGALSVVNSDCEDFYIYKGNPATKFLKRSRNFINLESEFLKKNMNSNE
ncbi:acyltransferase [Thermaurantimonas aggregans]|uniref:acyltransferase n=1 Tax=Thermaurantimonas aggregans TaxID=2173829 RepID=UPI001FE5D1E8|nr:hypothetical protein [Thermaurantimonas aggregans]